MTRLVSAHPAGPRGLGNCHHCTCGGGVGVIIEDITMPSLPSFDEELCPAEGGGLGHPAPQEGSPVLAVENIRLGHH